MTKEFKAIKYNIIDEFDHIIEEKGNQILALRKLTWGDSEQVHLDLRRWTATDNGERVGKGTSFFTEDEGPSELINILIEEGYGYTDEILNRLSVREDFSTNMSKILGDTLSIEQLEKFSKSINKEEFDSNEELYDPREDLFN